MHILKKKKNTTESAVHNKHSISVRSKYAMPNIDMEQAKSSTGFFFFSEMVNRWPRFIFLDSLLSKLNSISQIPLQK